MTVPSPRIPATISLRCSDIFFHHPALRVERAGRMASPVVLEEWMLALVPWARQVPVLCSLVVGGTQLLCSL